uniref:N-acetyltransferase 6 n=2 Tax=Culex pipiens TaxID=7175 RepID=A0A8D8P3F2_CULPI
MENVFIATKDLQVLSVKIKYDFYQSGFVPGTRKYKILDYGFCYEAREELPEMIKKLIITTNPKEWIAKEQERLNEDLYYQRQHYYYYYYYNEDEDDDSYYQDRLARKRVLYDGPPPPTSKEPYVVTPIHHHPELKEQCVRLINSEWSRSRMARFWGFESSTDTLPITLILAQMIKGSNTVLGHVKLSPVPADLNAVYVESLVVDHRYRGRGVGTYLMTEAERFCKKVLNVNNVYLATDGQEYFYAKLGYIFCKAINIFGTNTTRNTSSKKHWMKKVISDWEVEGEEVDSSDKRNLSSTNLLNVPSSEEINIEHSERQIPNINDLIRSIRKAVYNYTPKQEKEETICDLILTMHSI